MASFPERSRKVQVTILASEWGSSKGALSTLNRELAIQFAKCPEADITFFLPKCSQEDEKLALQHNVKIVEASRLPGFEELDWLSFPPEHLQIDVIVGHGVKLGKQAQIIKERKKCKWIQVVHTDPVEVEMFKNYFNPFSKGEEKLKTDIELCEMADLVVGIGPKLSEAFRQYLLIYRDDESVVDLTPGVFEEFVSVNQDIEERKRPSVLVFGRGDAEDFELKGLDIAVKAVAALRDWYTHPRLVLVGAPDGKQEEIARQITRYGVRRKYLTVRAYIDDRESLRRLFQEVDLVVMPSETEGFGLAGLEALSAGLPVLVSGNSGFGEALCSVPFGSSFVVDSADPTVWTAAITKVWAKDRKSRLEEVKTLRDSYGKKFNWAKQIRDLLHKMISWTHVGFSNVQSFAEAIDGTFVSSHLASQGTRGTTEKHAVTDVQVNLELKEKLQFDGCFLDPEKYDPVKFLGSGGYAKVYLVVEKQTGKKMASKMCDLGANTSDTQKLAESMKIEVRALTSLKHDHIVEFFFGERIRNTFLLFLEYMEGGTLEDLLGNNGRLEEPLVVKFTRQLLSAVDYLHTNGKKHIVHKDIKGSNILLDGAQKNIKLADFGICTIMEKLRTATSGLVTKNNVASFHWTSPELLGEETFTRNTDIWSVGCTVVEMLTTKPPLYFENLTRSQKMFRIVKMQIEPPTDCTPLAFGFLKRCLCPKETRASAAELLADPYLNQERQ